MASGKPLSPSTQAIKMSCTPRVFSSVTTCSQNLAPSVWAIHSPNTSLCPGLVDSIHKARIILGNGAVRFVGNYTTIIGIFAVQLLGCGGCLAIGQGDVTRDEQTIRQAVKRNVGIPVCVGIADTKTLAKLANHCAKKGLAGENGVCDFGRLDEHQRKALFSGIPVGEIWGVGRRIAEKLLAMNIETVEGLRTASQKAIRDQFSVVLERTVQELNGIPCIELEEAGAYSGAT